MNPAVLGMRNAFRNTTRTLSLVLILGLSTGLSLVMLISHHAVNQKIQDTKKSIGNTISVQPAGYSSFSQTNNLLSAKQVKKVSNVAHVINVTKTLSSQLTTEGATQPEGLSQSGSGAKTSLTSAVKLNKGSSNGMNTLSGGGLTLAGNGNLPENISLPIAIVGTSNATSPHGLQEATSLKITAGRAIGASKNTNDAMVSTSLAKKNNLKVGSTFTAYGKTFTVKAIYDTGTEGGNNTVIVSLPTMQHLMDKKDGIASVTATVDSLDNLRTTTAAIKTTLGSAADVTSSIEQADQALQPLSGVKKVSLFSLSGAVIASGVIIFMTMIMVVRERRREIGILKAIGASNIRIIFQFMSEALTLTCLGLVVGLVIGVAGGTPVTKSLVSNSISSASAPGATQTIHNLTNPLFQGVKNVNTGMDLGVLLIGVCVALCIALLSSACAGWLIAKIRPAEVMRQD